MPGFAQLGDASVKAIIDYIESGKDVAVTGAELAPSRRRPEIRN